MVERRRYRRYPVHYDVLYQSIKAPYKKMKRAIAENASRTGLKIRYNGLLKRNDLIKVKILKSLDSKPIDAYAKVVWQKESPLVYGERWAGIFLTKVGWTETERLISKDI